jgi:predicted metal-dependent HD superfamily phosphohydrolase
MLGDDPTTGPPADEQRLHDRWDALCARVGSFGSAAEADLTFEMIRGLYGTPPRAYHNLDHIAQCLDVLDGVRMLADDADAVEMALWLHDCVFIAMRDDNEEQSAFVAQTVASLIGAAAPFVSGVVAMIDATRHDGRMLAGDPGLVQDIDLSILGADPIVYDNYRRAIREEFAFADDERFNAGRLSFIARQLGRPRVYATAYFKAELEARARGNLQRERDELERWMDAR